MVKAGHWYLVVLRAGNLCIQNPEIPPGPTRDPGPKGGICQGGLLRLSLLGHGNRNGCPR